MTIGKNIIEKQQKLTEFGFPVIKTKLKLKESKQKQRWHSDYNRVRQVLGMLSDEFKSQSDRDFVFNLRAYLLRNPNKSLTPRQKRVLNQILEKNQVRV